MVSIDGGFNPNVGGVQRSGGIESIDRANMSIQDLMMAVMVERSMILDDRVRSQANQVRAKNEELKTIAQFQSEARVAQNQSQNIVDQNTWSVENKVIKLDNGYSIELEGTAQAWKIKDAQGNEVRIWGDPHVAEGDGGRWDFKENATFVLDDGTKITVGTSPWGSGSMTVSDTLTITRGNQAINVTGIADNNPQISGPNLTGLQTDKNTNDGYVFQQLGGVDDWSFEGTEITSNKAMDSARTFEQEAANVPRMTQEMRDYLTKNGMTFNDQGDGVLSLQEWDNVMKGLKDLQESLTSTSQLDMAQLQSTMGKYNQTFEMLSNFTSKFFQSLNTITGNIR